MDEDFLARRKRLLQARCMGHGENPDAASPQQEIRRKRLVASGIGIGESSTRIARNEISSPGFEPGLRPSQSRVRSPTLRGCELYRRVKLLLSLLSLLHKRLGGSLALPHQTVPRRGFEPRPAASKAAMRSSTPAGLLLLSGLTKDVSTWIRTRTRTFGGSDAIRYTIETICSQARARGVEPREAVLEAAGSPRSTLV
jgi:hypothetical protein